MQFSSDSHFQTITCSFIYQNFNNPMLR